MLSPVGIGPQFLFLPTCVTSSIVTVLCFLKTLETRREEIAFLQLYGRSGSLVYVVSFPGGSGNETSSLADFTCIT